MRALPFLLALTLVLPGCDAIQDLVEPPDDGSEAAFEGLAIAPTDDPAMPYVAVHEDGEMMAIEADPATGALTRATMTDEEGYAFTVSFGPDGTPTRLTTGDMVFVIGNIRPGLADLVAIYPDGGSAVFRDVAFDEEAVAELRTLARSARLGRPPSVSELFGAAALGIGITGCTMVGVGTVALAVGATGPLAPGVGWASGTACAGTIVALIREYHARHGGASQPLEDTNAAFTAISMTANTGLCVAMEYRSCLEAIAAALSILTVDTSETETARQTQIDDAEAVLQGGGGDVQISLAWDNEADLDLWVTDPAGERIYYGNRSSASGGQLDVDDRNGFGPENIFWPEGEAPEGTYRVQLDHYSGPAPSGYRILLIVGERAQTFSGSIGDDQTLDITTFTVGSARTVAAAAPSASVPRPAR
jgi:hypothetical protein